MTIKPAFITFTGIDNTVNAEDLVPLSKQYPIEWGVLVDRDKRDIPLFPGSLQISHFREAGVRLCAHICGEIAHEVATNKNPLLNLAGFSRIQVNHGRDGASSDVVSAVCRFAARHGVRGVLQCNGDFPVQETSVDWLYDVSFGEGVKPSSFPTIRSDHPFCGFSGGIGPGNVTELLSEKMVVDGGNIFWIDMESGVRSNNQFDLDKCEAVCRAVYD